MNTKFLLSGTVMVAALGGAQVASSTEAVQKFTVDDVETFADGRATGIPLNFEWEEISDSIMELESLTISQPETLDKIVDITVNIGANGLSTVRIAPSAFQGLKSDRVRLHLVFKDQFSKKVELPRSCSGLFEGSTSI